MTPRLRAILVVILTCALASPALAETLRVSVTGAAGKSVFIDRGRGAGVVPGLRVRFTPPGALPVDGVVADASASGARVELLGGETPPLGTPGEIELPVPPPAPATNLTTRPSTPAPTRPTTAPAHAPWERQDGPRTPDMPLLSPAYSRPPEQRPMNIHGRAYTDFQLSFDQNREQTSRYLLLRAGTAFTVTNPFGNGGELRFDGEYDFRDTDIGSGDSQSESDVIIRRLSYAMGTEQYAPYRLELGRFTSYWLPEIGLVDGIEAAVRFQNGFSLGGGAGGYPRPFVHDDFGQDLGFHVFADYSSKDPGQLIGTLGFQHTWRDGVPDRDLLIGHASVWLNKSLWLYGSATADLYSESNGVKSAGPQLTSALVQARFTPDSTQGASLIGSRFTWADIRGRDYPPVPADLLRVGRVDRVELAVWHDIIPNVRPTARVYYFDSDRANGFGCELDLDWTNIGGLPLDLHTAIFKSDGEFASDWGFRSQAALRSGQFDVSVGYEFLRYTFPGTETGMGMTDRHTIQTSVGWQTGDWYYSVKLDRSFGKADDAYRLGAYVEYRF